MQFAYNDFSQLTADYQAHGGAVNTSTTPKVQYGYANGSDNTIRPTTMTYPDGRVITYDYGTTSGINDASSRIASLIDDDVSATHLVDYSYLGSGTFVIADDTEPETKWTLADLTGTNDPDTGDIYSGFDRFGRVKDNRWYDYGSSTDVDRIKYGYNRASNRTYRENTVADALGKHFDELYGNDFIQRLKDLERGTLNGTQTAITNKSFAECWSLDETGNWKGYLEDTDGDDTWDLNQSRTSNDVNEITDITETAGASWTTPVYNKPGNMTTMPQPGDPTSSYTATYDAWNRLVKIEDGATTIAEYEYDGSKHQTLNKKYASGSLDETEHLYYSKDWQMLEKRIDAETDPQAQNIWGLRYIDDCVLRDRDTTNNGTLGERLYALQDANWNVDALINTSGTVQERFAYSAYGSPTFLNATFVPQVSSASLWQTLYAGYHWEETTELFHVRNRVYHSALGTWVQRDPLGILAGINLYEYVANNPLCRVDPNGTDWQDTTRDWMCSAVDDHPCVAQGISCGCFLVDMIDVIVGLHPAASLFLNSLDCLCEMASLLIVSCTDNCGNENDIDSAFDMLTPAIMGCMSDFIGFSELDSRKLLAIFELIAALVSEASAEKSGESGIRACFDLMNGKGACF